MYLREVGCDPVNLLHKNLTSGIGRDICPHPHDQTSHSEPLSLLCNGHWIFPQRWNGWSMNFTTCLHLMTMSRCVELHIHVPFPPQQWYSFGQGIWCEDGIVSKSGLWY